MPRPQSPFLPVLAGMVAGARLLGSETPDPAGIDFFENRVRPLLAEHCYECHSDRAEKVRGGLRLDTRDGWEKGGASGPAIIPGQPDRSLLLQVVRGTAVDVDRMPPAKGDRPPLDADQIRVLEEWVRLGAPDPRVGPATAAANPSTAPHWAFQPPVDPPRPAVRAADWPRTGLDHFVLAPLEAQGLEPMPPADPRTWLRRVTYDLTGLPPTPSEMTAFLSDTTPGARERVVDRLLASPRYGERWGRHWLDVARYADSKGYVFEEERRYPYSYTYRDWVVSALNADLPYDRFLVEQIAGDRVATPGNPEPMAALGFLTLGRRFLNNSHDIIDDRIDVVTRGTMGLTVQCARCHDHKYDPIPTADYYSLYGIFASSEEPGEKPLLGDNPNPVASAEYRAERDRRAKELGDYREEQTQSVLRTLREKVGDYLLTAQEGTPLDGGALENLARSRSLDPGLVRSWLELLQQRRKESDPVFAPWFALAEIGTNDFAAAAARRLEELAAADASPAPNVRILSALRGNPPTSFADVGARYGEVLGAAARAREETGTGDAADPADEPLHALLHGPDSPITRSADGIDRFFATPVAQKNRALRRKLDELDATHPGAPRRAMALVDRSNPVTPVVFKRGNPGNHGDPVPRRFLEVLSGPERPEFQDGSGRLELARAIASRSNPLTARVLVNRVWLRLIGSPLVRTPSDFGVRSDPPTHPELLDHLAVWFMDHGWSLKQLHREILLSATYGQASDPGADPVARAAWDRGLELDPANTLLWHMNRKRLDFEGMRDGLLAATGELDSSLGGQPVEIFNDTPALRRTLYGFIDRQNLPGLLRAFDFASPDATSPLRYQTTVPQQALFLLNSPFLIERARHLARHVGGPTGDPEPLVRELYRRLYQREPEATELDLAVAFLQANTPQAPPAEPADAWQLGLGRFDADAGRVADFRPFGTHRKDRWQPGDAYPLDDDRAYAALNPRGGHPGRTQDHSVVRRWTAPAGLTLRFHGTLDHPGEAGDGVRARLVSDRRGVLGTWEAHNGKVDTSLPAFPVEAGEVLDLIVDNRESDNTDSFTWTARLEIEGDPMIAARAGLPTLWDTVRDFSGPRQRPEPLTPSDRLAQVLLASNEFFFID